MHPVAMPDLLMTAAAFQVLLPPALVDCRQLSDVSGRGEMVGHLPKRRLVCSCTHCSRRIAMIDPLLDPDRR